MKTDVLIVGGGPAGLAAAIALRQRGLECTVVEARAPRIDKACGEGLMPDTIAALASLGIRITPADGHVFSGIRFLNQHHSVAADFPDGIGIGVRRPHLHDLLRRRAEASGASLLWESHIKLADNDSATINGAPIRFRWLIGADGHASSVRRWAGLARTRTENLRYSFRRHYNIRPWSPHVEVYWGPNGQYYITPVAPDCICLAYVTRDPKALRTNTVANFPELAERLNGAAPVSQQRGAISVTRKLHRVARSNIALIGDASGSTDSTTGQGLGIAFHQAQALANAITNRSLRDYEREHRRIGRLPHMMSRLMLAMDRWPRLEARALQALSSNPTLMSDFLALHTGHHSPLRFALTRGPILGWNIARA